MLRGYTGLTPPACPSVDEIAYALYIPQYWSDTFRIYTSYQPTSGGMWRVKFLKKNQILIFCRQVYFMT